MRLQVKVVPGRAHILKRCHEHGMDHPDHIEEFAPRVDATRPQPLVHARKLP